MARYIIMEKLDAFAPWHSIREYKTEQEARWQAYQWQKAQGILKYPKYDIMSIKSE